MVLRTRAAHFRKTLPSWSLLSAATAKKRLGWKLWRGLTDDEKSTYKMSAALRPSGHHRDKVSGQFSRKASGCLDDETKLEDLVVPPKKKRRLSSLRQKDLASIGQQCLTVIADKKYNVENVSAEAGVKRLAKTILSASSLPDKKKRKVAKQHLKINLNKMQRVCKPRGRPVGSYSVSDAELIKSLEAVTEACCIISRKTGKQASTWQGSVKHCWRKSRESGNLLGYRQTLRRTAAGKLGILKARKDTDMCDVCTTFQRVTSVELERIFAVGEQKLESVLPIYFKEFKHDVPEHAKRVELPEYCLAFCAYIRSHKDRRERSGVTKCFCFVVRVHILFITVVSSSFPLPTLPPQNKQKQTWCPRRMFASFPNLSKCIDACVGGQPLFVVVGEFTGIIPADVRDKQNKTRDDFE